MPVPPFGFSVGDFVSCASLIGDIIRALNDCKGSKPEYQALSETLQSLSQALTVSHVVYLQWDTAVLHPQYRDNASALLEGMGKVRQKCLDLMQKFLDKAQPYTDAFLRERGSRVTRDWRKVTWLFQKGDVKALREELNTHLQTLQEFTNAFFQ
jgi:predicted molibdopterin-dependent oxidoreductase YjgC